MTDVALSILALISGGLILEVFAAARQVGGSDEGVFPLVVDAFDGTEEWQVGNPS